MPDSRLRAKLPDQDEPFMRPPGSNGPGGWDCHTFEDGETFPLICLAPDCPDKEQRNPDRFAGELLA